MNNITYRFELASRPNRDGLHVIYLRITANRKHKRIKTPVAVKTADFNPFPKIVPNRTPQWIKGVGPAVTQQNELLYGVWNNAVKQHAELVKAGGTETAETLVNHIKQPPSTITVGVFADQFLELVQRHSIGYEKQVKSKVKAFVAWIGREAPLKNISLDLLQRYELYLNQQGVSKTNQHYHFSRIKRMTNEAIRLELLEKDPFLHFEMPPDKPQPRLKLTDAQIQAIENLDLGKGRKRTDAKGRKYELGEWVPVARSLYLFSFYNGGIRASDIIQLRYCNIVDGRCEYQMNKTSKLMSSKLSAKSKEILKQFHRSGAPAYGFLFALLSDEAPYAKQVTYDEKKRMPRAIQVQLDNDVSSILVMINRALKDIAKLAGIEERLTFHTARHSFADKARRKMKESKNVSIDDIRNALGHTRLDTTQRYLNSFDREGLDSAMDAIFDD
ncbi:tyrosine-type recombinase/integrase [Arsenicibacter rosenii]|uniref:Tyr recombinase domain-containing protein n=1 Tax=Arsenicibacter rosenii TaxID=1750698 RepID=A0A1S2VC87_9BACT|nr:tyrosine-type recombinase/integrase [Arsenicibacter rosenii]OIN56323.1 hypothetical protein BLX24_25145 [Arsenicibacter rosenii]